MNERRKVLVVAYYFPPYGLSGVQRTVQFVKNLTHYGWQPIVFTPAPEAASVYAFDESSLAKLPEGTVIYRTPAPKSRKKSDDNVVLPSKFWTNFKYRLASLFRQPDNRIGWKKTAVLMGKRIIQEEKIEVIFAVAPPFTDFLIAAELAKECNLPFVVDYRHLWQEDSEHFYPTPFHKAYNSKIEQEILNRVDKIIVTSRQNKEKLLQTYGFLRHNDVRIVPHGFDDREFLDLLRKYRPNPEKFTITHAGVFHDTTPKYFLKALNLFLTKHPEAKAIITARFVGAMRKNHAKLVKKNKLESNVEMTGFVEHSEVLKNLVESDVLWLVTPLMENVPGRMSEYFGARKPIIVCAPEGSFARTLATESKAAIAVNPKDMKQIMEALETLYEQWQKHQLPVPNEKFVSQFDSRKLAGDLSRELGMSLRM